MNRPMILAAVTLTLAGSALAFYATESETDYAALPRPHGEIEAEIRACKVTLRSAIEKVEQEVGGIAASAEVDVIPEPPEIEVVVYNDQAARLVTINANSGEIISNEAKPRFPGDPVSGQPTSTESGLQYFVINDGPGGEPVGTDATVYIHLSVWLVDGKEVLTSRGKQPMEIQISTPSLIRGIGEALATMTDGEKRKLLIPSDLAFGERSSPQVPANATLIADVEIVPAPDYASVPPVDDLPGDPVEGEPVTTESGLKYYDIREGDGPSPDGPAATVRVHYTGWLVDGTKFDSSVDRGDPFRTALTGVIRGWTEGLQTMKVGGKRKLIIPATLGYGASGSPPNIPGGATLVFDVELLEIIGQ